MSGPRLNPGESSSYALRCAAGPPLRGMIGKEGIADVVVVVVVVVEPAENATPVAAADSGGGKSDGVSSNTSDLLGPSLLLLLAVLPIRLLLLLVVLLIRLLILLVAVLFRLFLLPVVLLLHLVLLLVGLLLHIRLLLLRLMHMRRRLLRLLQSKRTNLAAVVKKSNHVRVRGTSSHPVWRVARGINGRGRHLVCGKQQWAGSGTDDAAPDEKRMTKAEVLELATRHIKTLSRENSSLRRECQEFLEIPCRIGARDAAAAAKFKRLHRRTHRL
ncbi:hypothetical protein B0T24DRAFT_712092 [Lasiosphaeria ovina]|uniref:Uncharacterized protein n=1 Tax=Lasiosphaeria ovina TaxID=92902 RepID=A0AAE0JVG1_9PEZI|nr:hypothetical protein B0T24DRAFT_712092 [Lasiosphaeria ovina]